MPSPAEMPPIRLLDEATISRIAAGEVVERPASVVKELVENSLDAGASAVRIEIAEGGRELIRVTDDGVGVPADQLALAFHRHATSKVRTADDIVGVPSLGFRGEALAAISSVARVRMLTRTAEGTGMEIAVVDGVAGTPRPTGAPVGTTVEVESLFYSVPARRKFLASAVTESNRVADVVARIALAFPQVQFTLVRDGRTVLATPGTGKRLDAVAAVLGRAVAAELVAAASAPGGSTRMEGLVSPPSLHRASRRDVLLYVNHRWIQDKTLAVAVTQAYRNLLPKGRFPIAVLWIDLAAADVDVNVHPAKTEVRFREPDRVFGVVMRSVREAAAAAGPARALHGGLGKGAGGWRPDLGGGGGVPDRPRLVPDAWSYADRLRQPDSGTPGAEGAIGAGGAASGAHGGEEGRLAIDPFAESDRWTGAVREAASRQMRHIPPLRLLGQVHLTYIVAEGPDGLVVVDQHAAHERVLFESLLARDAPQPGQALLSPEAVEVGTAEAAAAQSHVDLLARFGFDVEPFGPGAVLVRAVPPETIGDDPARLIRAVLDELIADAGASANEARVASVVCKRASVKAGQSLSEDEMAALLQGLENAREPLTCPHGRPTIVAFDAIRLAREFGRL